MNTFALENIVNFKVITIYLSIILSFFVLYTMSKKKVNYSLRTLTGLLLGLFFGVLLTYLFNIDKDLIVKHVNPFGIALRSIFSVIVIPLISTSIIKSFTSINDTVQLKKYGYKSLFWLLGTTALATIIGIIFGLITKVGSNFPLTSADASKAKEIPNFSQVLIDMIPTNIIKDMSNNRILPVIVFSIIVSIAMIIERSKDESKVKPLSDLINSISNVMFRVTKMVLKLVPYGVFAIMVKVTAVNGLSTLKELAYYIIVVYSAMLFHFVFIQLGLITYVAKMNPIQFVKKMAPAQLFAFSTQSSYATLPVTIRSLTKRVGVSERIAGFVSPLGANIGMNACGGLFPAVVAIFVANAYDVKLTIAHYIILVLTTTISSIGIAGVPGIATLSVTVVLTTLGLPLEGIGIIAGVDALIDMGRTAVNVTGTAVASTLVAKSENELDIEIFNSDSVETE